MLCIDHNVVFSVAVLGLLFVLLKRKLQKVDVWTAT